MKKLYQIFILLFLIISCKPENAPISYGLKVSFDVFNTENFRKFNKKETDLIEMYCSHLISKNNLIYQNLSLVEKDNYKSNSKEIDSLNKLLSTSATLPSDGAKVFKKITYGKSNDSLRVIMLEFQPSRNLEHCNVKHVLNYEYQRVIYPYYPNSSISKDSILSSKLQYLIEVEPKNL